MHSVVACELQVARTLQIRLSENGSDNGNHGVALAKFVVQDDLRR